MKSYATTKKLNHYRKQLALLYRGTKEPILENIISISPIYVNEEVHYDNLDYGTTAVYHQWFMIMKDTITLKLDKFDEGSVSEIDNSEDKSFFSVSNKKLTSKNLLKNFLALIKVY